MHCWCRGRPDLRSVVATEVNADAHVNAEVEAEAEAGKMQRRRRTMLRTCGDTRSPCPVVVPFLQEVAATSQRMRETCVRAPKRALLVPWWRSLGRMRPDRRSVGGLVNEYRG